MKSAIYSQVSSVATSLASLASPGSSEFRIVLDGFLGAVEGRANPFRRHTFYWRLWNAGRRAASCSPRPGSETHIDSEAISQSEKIVSDSACSP